MNNKAPLIVALLFGLISFLGLTQWVLARETGEKKVLVLVVKRPVEKGKILRPDDLAEFPISADAAQKTPGLLSPKDRARAIGIPLRVSLKTGDLLLSSCFEELGAGDLPVYRPFNETFEVGKRAVSITVDNAGMVSGFLQPGDLVDILANVEVPQQVAQTMMGPQGQAATRMETVFTPTTIFLFQSIRVLAIGSTYERSAIDPSRRAQALGGNTVTVALTPREAQILSYVMRHGRRATGRDSVTFTLLLRSAGDRDPSIDLQGEVVSYEDFLALAHLGSRFGQSAPREAPQSSPAAELRSPLGQTPDASGASRTP